MPEEHLRGGISEARALEIAEKAAEKAMTQTLRLLGIDMSLQEAINEKRDDWSWLHRQRMLKDRMSSEVRSSFLVEGIKTLLAMALGAAGIVAAYYGLHGGGH